MKTSEKIYIGKVEAYEIALERNIMRLPRKGREILTVYATATGRAPEVLGKDEVGFYIAEVIEPIDCQDCEELGAGTCKGCDS